MTVNTTIITAGPYPGNDITVAFPYGFRITDKSQIAVFETDNFGVKTLLVVDTDYTVSGIGVDAGGEVTRVAGALPTDYEWYMRANYPKTQLTSLPSQGGFLPEVHEDAFDKLTFLVQQMQDSINRSMRLSDTIDIDGDFTIDDDAAARSGKSLSFDTSGDLVVVNLSPQSITADSIFDNVALAKASNPAAGLTVTTRGYNAAGDAGGAIYLIKTIGDFGSTPDGIGDHLTDDGFNVLVLQIENNLVPSRSFGMDGSSTSSRWQTLFDSRLVSSDASVAIDFDISSLDGAVDCNGAKIICSNTVIPSALNTFTNHSGIDSGVIAGVNTSKFQHNLTMRPSYDKAKYIRWDSGKDFSVFMAKKNPFEGYLEVTLQADVTTTTNSIGGNSATRVTVVKNVNDLIGYKHTFASANHTPVDTVVRTIGGGTGGQQAAFWDIPAVGGVIRFATGLIIDEVSILFLLSGGSSDDVTVRWDGVDVDTISLVQPAGGPDYFIYRLKVVPGVSEITLINNSATATAFVAGINAYRPADDSPENNDVDTLAYSYNTNDYTNSAGAVDYALRRHSDDYAGSDPTGGSYHGGETILSESIRLDGNATSWLTTASIGDIASAKRIEFVSNVDVIWPSDLAEVNVTRLNQIGDGAIFKDVRIIAGAMVFDAVWTTMWTTPLAMTSARGLTARDISGVSSEFQCYDRGNEIRQDISVNFGVRNSWTMFDDERNSNGGPYIASELGTRAKLYYGPILFNKGSIGTVHTQQYTEFFGQD